MRIVKGIFWGGVLGGIIVAPDGATLTMPASPTIQISKGARTTSDNCHAPNCRFVNATMTGFAPNTTYPITLSSNANPNVRTESFTASRNTGYAASSTGSSEAMRPS